MTVPAIDDLVDALSDRIRGLCPDLLADLPPSRYIRDLDDVAPYASYDAITSAMNANAVEIARRAGQSGLEDYHKLVLLVLMKDFEERAVRHRYPDCIRAAFLQQFRRITNDIERDAGGTYLYSHDSFCKDLGICRQRLIPCGTQLLEWPYRLSARLLLRGGVRQALRVLGVIGQLGGLQPLYRLHIDHRQLQDFSASGWQRCYAKTAALLKLNPQTRGLLGCTWYWDPAVCDISPHLRYLHEVPKSGGAAYFFVGQSEHNTEDAIAKSRERRRRYLEGSYQPKIYAMVWPRSGLLQRASSDGWDQD